MQLPVKVNARDSHMAGRIVLALALATKRSVDASRDVDCHGGGRYGAGGRGQGG